MIKDEDVDADKDISRFLVRMPKNVMGEIRELSSSERRSINSQIVHMLEVSLDIKAMKRTLTSNDKEGVTLHASSMPGNSQPKKSQTIYETTNGEVEKKVAGFP